MVSISTMPSRFFQPQLHTKPLVNHKRFTVGVYRIAEIGRDALMHAACYQLFELGNRRSC